MVLNPPIKYPSAADCPPPSCNCKSDFTSSFSDYFPPPGNLISEAPTPSPSCSNPTESFTVKPDSEVLAKFKQMIAIANASPPQATVEPNNFPLKHFMKKKAKEVADYLKCQSYVFSKSSPKGIELGNKKTEGMSVVDSPSLASLSSLDVLYEDLTVI